MTDYIALVNHLRERAAKFDYDGWVETAIDMERAADAIQELYERTAGIYCIEFEELGVRYLAYFNINNTSEKEAKASILDGTAEYNPKLFIIPKPVAKNVFGLPKEVDE